MAKAPCIAWSLEPHAPTALRATPVTASPAALLLESMMLSTTAGAVVLAVGVAGEASAG
jgi:hypothetical protein